MYANVYLNMPQSFEYRRTSLAVYLGIVHADLIEMLDAR